MSQTEDKSGFLRRALTRLSSDPDELDARELQHQVAARGATRVCDCSDRDRVTVTGVLESVRLHPRGGVPALEAELYDGSGEVTLIWLGRRRIAGIEPGRSLVARGRMTLTEGSRTIFNPDYELRPAHASH